MRPLTTKTLQEGIVRLSHNKGGILGTKFHYVKPTGPYVAPIRDKARRYSDMLNRAEKSVADKQGIDTQRLSPPPGHPEHEKYKKFYDRSQRIYDKIKKKQKGGGDIGYAAREGDVKARLQHQKWSDTVRRNSSLPRRLMKGVERGASEFMRNVRRS